MLEVYGLIPAAGKAERLGSLPCSKEIFPLGFHATPNGPRPRPVCGYLLESFCRAGVGRALILLRQGKWDIPALLGRGTDHGLDLAYLVLDTTTSVPETLDSAYPFVAEARVALGFPDILFEPSDAYVHLLGHQDATGSEIVLGLFPTDQCAKTDMVELDRTGRVRRLVIKQPDAGLTYTWSIAVWGPEFSQYLHDFVRSRAPEPAGHEHYVGNVIQAAIDDGMKVAAVPFPQGSYLDVGTPEELKRAVAELVSNPYLKGDR